MSKASVRVTSESSSFQQEMKKAVQSMKELSSETSLATTQAKLFGTAQEQLKAKVSGLQAKIEQQANIVKLNKDRQQELVQQLDKWKSKQAELQTKIQTTKAALEASTEATGENSDETKALKAELEELIGQEKDAATQVTKTEEKLSKQTVATNKSEQALAEMQAELETTNKELKNAAWDEWTKKADKATEAMDKVGKKLMVVTGAIVGMGTAAVKTTADFDAEMSTVQSISGATGEDFDALRDKALEMGSSTAFSASEAAEAMEYMAMAGWSTEDMLDGISGVMSAAAASGEDLATTSDILTDGLTAFGLAAEDSAHFADVLVAAGNNANTSVSMMGETFKYAGAVCGTLGISVEDCAIATGLMGNAGIKASQAGTALRGGLSKLISPTDDAAAAMEKYGFSIATTEDGSVDFMGTMKNLRAAMGDLDATTQAQALSTIFGTEAMSGWAAIVSASDEDFQSLTDAIYNCEGAAEAAADVKLDNLSGQITILKSTIEGIAIQIGDILMPTIRNVVSKIQEWATAFSEADEGTKKTIVTIAGIVAAIGPLILGISTAIKTVKNVVNAFKLMKTGLAAVKVALAGPIAPIALVVAAIAALVAAVVYLWNNNEEFRTAITNIWNGIKTAVTTAINAVKTTVTAVWNTIKTVTSSVWTSITTWITNTLNTIKTTFSNIWNAISTTVSNVWNTIKNVIQVGIMFVVELVKAAFNLITLPWQFIWQNCGDTITAAWETIKSAVSTAINFVKDIITTVLDAIKSAVSTAWNAISTTTITIWNAISAAISTVWNAIKSAVTTAINAVKTTVSNVWNAIKTATSTAWNSVKTTTSTVWNGIKTSISSVVNGIKSTVSTAFNAVKSTVSSIWNGIKSATTSTWNAIKSAITTPITNAKNTVSSMIEAIKSKFNFSWSLPKLKLPHLSITGKFSINPPSVPHFSISWYKTGAIMDAATIFGMNGNTMLGGGEAGKEAILPLEPFYVRLGNMLDEKLAKLEQAAQEVVVYVTCLIDGEEITTRQIVKIEKHLAGSSRAIRRATT